MPLRLVALECSNGVVIRDNLFAGLVIVDADDGRRYV